MHLSSTTCSIFGLHLQEEEAKRLQVEEEEDKRLQEEEDKRLQVCI